MLNLKTKTKKVDILSPLNNIRETIVTTVISTKKRVEEIVSSAKDKVETVLTTAKDEVETIVTIVQIKEVQRRLGLSDYDITYLNKTMGLSAAEIEKCCGELKLDVSFIKRLNCSQYTLLYEVPAILSKVGSIGNFKDLIICEYRIDEIKLLIEKFTCQELVTLANILTAARVYSLFEEETQNLRLLLSVINILKRDMYITNDDSALECYQELYGYIPDNLCLSLMDCANKISRNNNPSDSHIGYEEILIRYMDLAGGDILMEVGFADLGIPIIFECLEKIIKFLKPSYVGLIEYTPVKPFLLAAIWFALDVALVKQYIKNKESINDKEIGECILAFLISSMCGVTGYFHSGGEGLPFFNITAAIGGYFKIQEGLVKEHAPKIYNKIPERLKLKSNEYFEKLVDEEKKDVARCLSMVYTFRVGNAFLCSLLGNVYSLETAKNIFKSLWPLPQKAESIRMYFIYSGIPVYSNLNMEGVFVSIS